MQLNAISEILQRSITKLSEANHADQQELENVIAFGIKAIGTLEALIDTIMQPLKKSKAALYKNNDPEIARSLLIEIITEMYEELDEAQDMVFKFQSLTASFDTQIAPVLSKYLSTEEVCEWAGLFDLTSEERGAAFARVESLLPKIEEFLDTRFQNSDQPVQAKEIKTYINEVIAETRETKKNLQAVKARFLQLSGLKGLLNNDKEKAGSEQQSLSVLIAEIKEAVSNSRIEKALDQLEELCNLNYPDLLKDVIMLQSQFQKTKKDFNLGLDNDKVTQNRINYAILEILEGIEKGL